MSILFNSSDAFLLRILGPNKEPIVDFDTIAQGVKAVQHDRGSSSWGVISWFDKVSGNMRMVQPFEAPQRIAEGLLFSDDMGVSYQAIKITKSVYDTVIKRMMSGAPEIMEDKDAQAVLARLNPYT